MIHVLITGAAGMIGRKLTQRLARDGKLAGREITALSLVDITQPEKPAGFGGRLSLATLDASDAAAVARCIATRPDFVFHFAAVVSCEAEADFNKGYRINLDGTGHLLQAIRREGAKAPYRPRLVFTSSIAVFGAPFPEPIGDEFFATPLTSYGTPKAISELLVADYSPREFLDGISIRLPTICIRPGKPNKAASGFSPISCVSRSSARRWCCRYRRTCATGIRTKRLVLLRTVTDAWPADRNCALGKCTMTPNDDPRRFLLDLFRAAVASGDPQRCLPQYLPPKPLGEAVVVGAGKAAAGMAKAIEASWDGPIRGLVVCPHGCSIPTRQVEVVEASHPVPDEAGTRAAQRMLSSVRGLSENDLVLALISGGGSALLTLPAPALELQDKQAATQKLLKSGATIAEINCVRKHLSAIKGGRLAAAAWPAWVHALAISDVPGDDPSVIASGPTVADPTTSADALAIIERYGIATSEATRQWLSDTASETPKAGDVRLSRSTFQFISRPVDALRAAAEKARAVGVHAVILGDSIEGEAREVGRVMAGIALSAASSKIPVEPPCVLLSGGETTVTVRGTGTSGRNREFALSLAIALAGRYDISAIACDTDGIDGAPDAAGAIVLPDTIARARQKGLDPHLVLADNDAGGLFGRLGDQVVTGPTGTNLNDFRAIYIPGSFR